VQSAFEESLLDRELWISVDLLQSMGMQHHHFFASLLAQVQTPDVTTAGLKESVRRGRADFSQWLFGRLEAISTQMTAGQAAQAAFEEFCNGLQHLCIALPRRPLRLRLAIESLGNGTADPVRVRLARQVARLRQAISGRPPTRTFHLGRLAEAHFLGALCRGMLNVAQMFGEAEFTLLRKVKGQYEDIDHTYTRLLEILDREKVQPDAGELVGRLEGVGAELDANLRAVGAEVMHYFEDLRAVVRAEVATAAAAFVRDAHRAGTAALPARKYRLSAAEADRIRRRVLQRLDDWGRCQAGLSGTYAVGLSMVQVHSWLRQAVDETVLQVNSRLQDRLEDLFQRVNSRVEAAAGVLRRLRAENPAHEAARAALEEERRELLGFLGRTVQAELASLQASGEINQLVDMLRERFRHLAAATPESFRIIEEERLPAHPGEVPASGELTVAPVRAVVRAYLEGELLHRLGDITGRMLQQVREMGAITDELTQNAGFSLGSAAIELREVGKSPADVVPVAAERLQRGLEGFRGHFQRLRESNRETHEGVIRVVADTARRLRQLVLEATVQDMQRRVGEQQPAWRRLLPRLWPRTRATAPAAAPATEAVTSPPAPGPLPPPRESLAAAAVGLPGLADLETELAARVPFAYRRLFRTNPLEVSEFLAARAEALGTIEVALRHWRQRRSSSVAIIGEQGSGKTSLINCAMEQKLKGLPLVRYRFTETLIDRSRLVALLSRLLDAPAADLHELLAKVSSSRQRRVVVLEDLHQMHLRVVHGLDLLGEFLEFLDATSKQIMWIVSVEQLAWEYLERARRLSRHFAFCIDTGQLSRAELESAIMARHQATGYKLRFAGGASAPAVEQDVLRRRFFDALHQASGGNVFAAIYYWLRAVAGVEEEAIIVAPLVELELGLLRRLPVDELLALALLIEHGGLTPHDFARVLRISTGEATARLAHLERIGLVEATAQDEPLVPRFVVSHVLYHHVSEQVKAKGLLR